MRAVLMAGLLVASPALAQPEPELREVAPGVHVLLGSNGNVLIVPSPGGALIVDSERPADAEEIRKAVAKLSPAPVRHLVDTHWHLDHSGGNEAFARAGATVYAHRNVRVRRSTEQFMPAYNARIPAGSAEALPIVTYLAAINLYVGGQHVSLRWAPAAHTDGDTIVRLDPANVVHMGDIYFNGIWPFIDRASGGGVEGLIVALDGVLRQADDKTVIVPAHGDIAGKADLARYRAMIADVADRVRKAIAAGQSEAQVVAAKPAAAWRAGMQGDEDRFVAAVYDSLKG
jgi:cyclase